MNELPPKSGYYTYALICPIHGDIFYIGKGKGDRVFNHEKLARRGVGENEVKNKRIRAAINSGESLNHLILSRHKIEREAYQHEDMLINQIGIENLTNSSPGSTTAGDGESNIFPYLYDYETTTDWAKDCLEVLRSAAGEDRITFLGKGGPLMENKLMTLFRKWSEGKPLKLCKTN